MEIVILPSPNDLHTYCPLQVGTVACRYYVMRYMCEIVSKDTNIITDAIDTRNSYSQLELDEVRVEWAEFLARHYTYMLDNRCKEIDFSFGTQDKGWGKNESHEFCCSTYHRDSEMNNDKVGRMEWPRRFCGGKNG
uniref:Uncharacterized protein n=1 Tax=Cucumis melo TaxID=3656 RepID=A0A9I9EEF4_CUCME